VTAKPVKQTVNPPRAMLLLSLLLIRTVEEKGLVICRQKRFLKWWIKT